MFAEHADLEDGLVSQSGGEGWRCSEVSSYMG